MVQGHGSYLVKVLPNRQAEVFQIRKKPFTAQDIRFTTKGDILYAIALGVSANTVFVKSLGTKAGNGAVASVELIGSNEKLSWSKIQMH
jgi:alpha-L-fucosidase